MNRDLMEDLQKYLQAKETPTAPEQDLLSRLNGEMQNFEIAFLNRAALKRHGYDMNAVTDGDMEEIAGRMGDNYCNARFSQDLCEACEELGHEKIPTCPQCESGNTEYNEAGKRHTCLSCGQQWSDSYALVEDPEETDKLPDDLGYPSCEAQNSNARYISQYDYIRIFGKTPEPNSYYEPVCWPESQKYMPEEDEGDDSINGLNELINDEKGLAEFGGNAYWVAKCNLK